MNRSAQAASTPARQSPGEARINPSNRFGLDYEAEARSFAKLPYRIIDVHSHINGPNAARLYKHAAEIYGIGLTYSMTQLEEVPVMREIFGERIRFIAVPRWNGQDKKHDMGPGFSERIQKYHEQGCRIVKFWSAPRAVEIGQTIGDPYFMRLNNPARIETMQIAHDLGMMFMTHIGDPDTWFATRYSNAAVFGSKRDQYKPLEEMLDRFTQPWIAAHMGGWPENLEFLNGLLERHPNLHLDTSAAKWMIREVSKIPRDELVDFLRRFKGRIMFGSDIVTMDEHLANAENKMEMAAKASNREQAFDLYASRYWGLRRMWESDAEGESPIADPDLKMVEPDRYTEMDAPMLRGKSLPSDLLRSLYHDAAHHLLESLHSDQSNSSGSA
jgi:predicted TIM-barrel fold metal-dependent hydrolase